MQLAMQRYITHTAATSQVFYARQLSVTAEDMSLTKQVMLAQCCRGQTLAKQSVKTVQNWS